MLPKDRQLISRLRKRSALLVVVVLILSYWLQQKYLDVDYYKSETDATIRELRIKDSQIQKLKSKIEKIDQKKPTPITLKKKKIINTNKEPKKDTLVKSDSIEPILEEKITEDTINQ